MRSRTRTQSIAAFPATPARAPHRRLAAALLASAALLLGAACDSGSRAASAAEGGAGADSVAQQRAAEQRAADSVAAWRARFGNRVPRPDSVRALYVNAWAAGSRSRMNDLIRMANETEINAFIIDIKESDTFLTYDKTEIALAKEIGADQRPASRWLPALVDTLQAHGIYPIARIVVFKDRVLAEKRPDMAIQTAGGSVWRDNKGVMWVNPYDRRVWDYNIAIAREALEMGFSEVQWDYVRFPDVTANVRRTLQYPGRGAKSPAENIREFIAYSKEQLKDYQVPITADVFGLVTHLEDDVGIGQNWEQVISVADVVLPMTYPSHYYTGLYGFQRPHANPYQILRLALQDAVERTEFVRQSGQPVGEIMPWLEAMSIRGLTYGPAEVRAQIQATYDAGLKSWALWNPGSRFAEYADALRPASGGPSAVERRGWRAPEWELPRARLSRVIHRREAAERAAADSARRAAESTTASGSADTTRGR